jgi:hypothetical protein
MGGYTRAVSGQRLSKHVPLLGSRFLIMRQLDATVKELCFLCGPCRDVISKEQSQLRDSSLRKSVKKGLELVAEE